MTVIVSGQALITVITHKTTRRTYAAQHKPSCSTVAVFVVQHGTLPQVVHVVHLVVVHILRRGRIGTNYHTFALNYSTCVL